MENYVGRRLKVNTTRGMFEGIMDIFDKRKGEIIFNTQFGVEKFNFDEILDITPYEEIVTDKNQNCTKESDMYSLFYEAFNVYGPFEDHFILSTALLLKKFLRDLPSAQVKIIIGSDDVFGRIGLCFARLLLGKTFRMIVELKCGLHDLKTLQYQNAFENSGGILNANSNISNFSLTLYACNRNFNFEIPKFTSTQTIILDIPTTLPFDNFTGIGLGFIPENSKICSKFFYLFDVGFGSTLCQKYKLPHKYKNSLVKIDVLK